MTYALRNTIAAGIGFVGLVVLVTAAAAHGPGARDGTGGGNPPAMQQAPGMGQGMMGGATGQGMMGQGMLGEQRIPCANQGEQASGPCAGQLPGQTPGQPPDQAPMLNQQVPPVRQ